MSAHAPPPPVFLTAEWRRLLMLSFRIDSRVLEPLVPRGTELDRWRGHAYCSLVAFDFLDTRVRGLAIPLHRHFDEMNLRFYVRRETAEGVRRGAVFVREVVPRRAIALVARWLYNENYVACPTRSSFEPAAGGGALAYGWRHRGRWLELAAEYAGQPALPTDGSEEEFITEHYWGYSTQRDGGTVEYRVEHPRWRVWSATGHRMEGDFAAFYGPGFAAALKAEPTSVFVAEGSRVSVRRGRRIV